MLKAFLALFLVLSVNKLLAQSSATAIIAATIEQAIGTKELTLPNQQYMMLSSEQVTQPFVASVPYLYTKNVDLASFRIINNSLLYSISIVPDHLERIPMINVGAACLGEISIKPLASIASHSTFVVKTKVGINHLFSASAATSSNLLIAVHFH